MAESTLVTIVAILFIVVGVSMIFSGRKIVKNDASNIRELLPILEIRRGYKEAIKEYRREQKKS